MNAALRGHDPKDAILDTTRDPGLDELYRFVVKRRSRHNDVRPRLARKGDGCGAQRSDLGIALWPLATSGLDASNASGTVILIVAGKALVPMSNGPYRGE
jgi:hypothetical protein